MKYLRIVLALTAAGALAVPAAAQTAKPADVTTMSLEDLLDVEVVSTASKFPQEVREAPASITVVTADEIRRYGHRTLSDVLRSVRGLYTTYDRNYTYIGVRGFARAGDYNTRVLLLVDGHRLNDPLYDMAPIGTDFPIDVSLIDKVEVIRGPGSSLYGTNAFFAVINVITRTGANHKGVQADSYAGSLGTRGTTVSFGQLFAVDRELLLAGSLYHSDGAERLHFPEFEAAGAGDGVAVGLDRDRSSSAFGSFSLGRVSLRGAMVSRRKQVPTASFEAVFGDARLASTDDRAYLAAEYDGPLGRGWLGTARLAYDYYGFEGLYPFDYGESGVVLWVDSARSQTASAELTTRKRVSRAHLLTAGTEVRWQFDSRIAATDDFGPVLEVRAPGTLVGAYVQDEIRARPWLILNAGLRLDRYPTFGTHAAPRAGLVILPRAQTSIKVLHGRAFRAPNPYENSYYTAMRSGEFTLGPEKVHSTEVVWEEHVTRRVRATASAFFYDAEEIIEQGILTTPDGPDLYFENRGDIEALGFEGEIEARLASGVVARYSQVHVRTRNEGDGSTPPNSPSHLAKASVQVPVSRVFLGFEGQYVGERRTIAGDTLDPFFVPNVTLTSPAGRRLDLSLGIYNAFNHSYADPGGEEHFQHSIPQDGRTFLARVRVRF